MGRRLFGMGVATTCLSLVGLLLNRPATPAYVASVLALCVSLAVVALSFVAPLVLESVVPASARAPAAPNKPTRPQRRRAAGRP